MSDERPQLSAQSAVNAETVTKLLKAFADESERTFDASADDVVRVRVGTSMNVVSVQLLDKALDERTKERLQLAIVSAVNLALQKAALAGCSATSIVK